jgi:hypothetical protein
VSAESQLALILIGSLAVILIIAVVLTKFFIWLARR